jgi:hypothetical protein
MFKSFPNGFLPFMGHWGVESFWSIQSILSIRSTAS